MVSATQLSSYLYCPRKLFISDVLLVKALPKEALVKGTVYHYAHELLNKSDEKIVLSVSSDNYQDIFDIYRRHYSRFLRNAIIKYKSELKEFGIQMMALFKEYWPHFEEEAKERALVLSKFISAHKIFGKALWEKLTPKIISEKYFRSEKLGLSGVIDVIEVHDNILHVPVELKTGKFPDKGMWDGHKIQLAAYMLLLEDAGLTTGEAVIKYKGSDKRVLSMNTFLRQEVLDLIHKTSGVLGLLEPPGYVDNKNKCKSCQYKDTCYDESRMKELVSCAENRVGSGPNRIANPVISK
jgi:CRISPR-associated protein Cas4